MCKKVYEQDRDCWEKEGSKDMPSIQRQAIEKAIKTHSSRSIVVGVSYVPGFNRGLSRGLDNEQ